MKAPILLLLSLLALLTGCVTHGREFSMEKISRLKPGMSKPEVEALAGLPLVKTNRPAGDEAWVWMQQSSLDSKLCRAAVVYFTKDVVSPLPFLYMSNRWEIMDRQMKVEQERYDAQRVRFAASLQRSQDEQRMEMGAGRTNCVTTNAVKPEIREAILTGMVVTGMTPNEARASWGAPSRINHSGGIYGTSEQWVYDRGQRNTYLHFRNDRLESWNWSQ